MLGITQHAPLDLYLAEGSIEPQTFSLSLLQACVLCPMLKMRVRCPASRMLSHRDTTPQIRQASCKLSAEAFPSSLPGCQGVSPGICPPAPGVSTLRLAFAATVAGPESPNLAVSSSVASTSSAVTYSSCTPSHISGRPDKTWRYPDGKLCQDRKVGLLREHRRMPALHTSFTFLLNATLLTDAAATGGMPVPHVHSDTPLYWQSLVAEADVPCHSPHCPDG